MKKIILFLLVASAILASNDQKIIKLFKTNVEVEIDGIIDPVWSKADSVTDFIQYQPYHNIKPTQKTVAKVLTTDEAIYCLMICYDNKNVTVYKTGILDDFGGDIVSFMIDTFNDKQTAYKFAVGASGFRSDARLLDDARNRDYSWDGIWFAATEEYDWGYVVEMKIPYKSIQYDKEVAEWGVDFDRWIPDENEDIYWCEYEESEGQRISKFGTMLFEDFRPSIKGLNLEIYPVAIGKAEYLGDNKYDFDPDAGIDVFYNPSPKLTVQATANPDFAQIEADPYDFNISRFESYFSERRPFFTEGNEIFMPSGRQRNTGFYRPMELFYSRRIGKKLPDGTEVPLLFGGKAFGRMNEWEYGGFVAHTGETDYQMNGTNYTEQSAYFASARVKKQIMENSSIGVLYVGKYEAGNSYGVLDIDGAFRGSNWQLAYQVARSFKNSEGDFAYSTGLTMFSDDWITLVRSRHVGDNFDVDQVGFVPWRGNTNFVGLSGPRWYFDDGYIRQILIYGGGSLDYQKEDDFIDYAGVFGYNMQFRDNWGFEINLDAGKAKDLDVKYSSYSANLSSWFNPSASFSGNVYGGYYRTYNFARDYLAFYASLGSSFDFLVADFLNMGTSYNMWVEGNPAGDVEDITYNARPYFSLTPVNNVNIKVYVDNVFVKSTDKLEQMILGFFFAYNFSPKSWIYFAYNEFRNRVSQFDSFGNFTGRNLQVSDRAAVLKIKYLYYF
ncbi:MAG: carbohydrate binding family 9 domain-containing protein [Melioribacteraceae bacterium]|nr:carbohydrate binding family 9 domain-containing protein [Melioribacteraceae bacterium]MCF8356972.1 carbohydrate binding family 9 domain-containing protein [Melioribacteraceae bacterium]MCF8394120.1 carbohydrate binding family 9 domain-containing protein [Melioribacteraceae bacterium]MCF8418142.1 carbohydrate binding family 9 domain-containing protein [Melioribacteraceae bacterium]